VVMVCRITSRNATHHSMPGAATRTWWCEELLLWAGVVKCITSVKGHAGRLKPLLLPQSLAAEAVSQAITLLSCSYVSGAGWVVLICVIEGWPNMC
jgi:hypothetical protein